MKKIIFILAISCLLNSAQAESLRINLKSELNGNEVFVSPGRITLIELGAPIKSQPWLVNKKIARVYVLHNPQKNQSVIALQGLSDKGSSDLTVRTDSGIINILINARSAPGEDLIIDKNHSSIINNKNYQSINTNRTALVKLAEPINEYVLAGDPDMVSCRAVFDSHDPNFLKSFALAGLSEMGKTDIVIATQEGIIKFELEVSNNEMAHDGIIDFSGD